MVAEIWRWGKVVDDWREGARRGNLFLKGDQGKRERRRRGGNIQLARKGGGEGKLLWPSIAPTPRTASSFASKEISSPLLVPQVPKEENIYWKSIFTRQPPILIMMPQMPSKGRKDIFSNLGRRKLAKKSNIKKNHTHPIFLMFKF